MNRERTCVAVLVLSAVVGLSSSTADDLADGRLERAREAHEEARAKAVEDVLAAFDAERERLESSSRLSASAKVDSVASLKAETAAFESYGQIPTRPELRLAAEKYDKRIAASHRDLSAALDAAAKSHSRAGNAATAERLTTEKASLFFEGFVRRRTRVAISSVLSEKVVAVSRGSADPGAQLVQWTTANDKPGQLTANQCWEFVPAEGGGFHIRNVNSGLVIGVKDSSKLAGAEMVQWPLVPGSADQTWFFAGLPQKDGETPVLRFVNKRSMKRLSLMSASRADGTFLIQADRNDEAMDQVWRLTPVQ